MIDRLFSLLLVASLTLFAGGEGSTTAETSSPETSAKECDGKLLIGEVEWVYLPAAKLKMKARIDTGATTTSIDARDIRIQERDGKKWAIFTLVDREKDTKVELEKTVVKVVSIKRHGMEDQKRYAVKMRLNLGSISEMVIVTLNDRSRFDYPVLIGRNFLRGRAVVDVEHDYTVEPVTTAGEQ